MALQEYVRKRRFSETPEPKPLGRPHKDESGRFCVQRHDATRLHYDFRLEIDGVLKSWAVPEGPSMVPGVKRLAVHVEDHPVDYMTFEGNIPAGNYGAGSVMVWDLGHFQVIGEEPGSVQIDNGELKFTLEGRKLSGEFVLVRLKNKDPKKSKGDNWLLIKKRDSAARDHWKREEHDYSVLTQRGQEEIAAGGSAPKKPPSAADVEAPASAAVKANLKEPYTPMLATLAKEPPKGDGWSYELKWDGVRAVCVLEKREVRIYSRKKDRIERQYPEIQALAAQFEARTAVIDGEIVVLNEKGRPDFHQIQPRIMASGSSRIAKLQEITPATFFAFDLLYLDGWDLRGTPLGERRALLEARLKEGGPIRLSWQFDTDPAELLRQAREQELEGVLAKRIRSTYQEGRSGDWLKLKLREEGEFVIAGWTEGKRQEFSSLVLGAYQDGKLRWSGNVGTGFDAPMLAAIRRRLDALKSPSSAFTPKPRELRSAHWVKPELVCTIRFAERTDDGKLRAPVFIGLRMDVEPKEAVLTPPSIEEPKLLLPDNGKQEMTVRVGRHSLKFTHLSKLYFPDDGITKRDLLNYYDQVSEFLLPHWRDRPLSLRRYPDGIQGQGFFQKNAQTGFPDWFRFEDVEIEDGEIRRMIVGSNREELLSLTQIGCIDQNPWMSRVGSLDEPDYVLIDLDPYECPFSKIVEAALVVKGRLDALKLTGYPKTTGGDGMHIYIPLQPGHSYEDSKNFAELMLHLCLAERPDLFTLPRNPAKRQKNRVYFDHMQNGRGKTASAPYVVRAYPGAPVATPLDWSEVTAALRPADFHLRNAPERFRRVGDIFAGALQGSNSLLNALREIEQMDEAVAAPAERKAAKRARKQAKRTTPDADR